MSFGLGLATGLAKGIDTGLQKSMERMRDQIDETAKYGLAFKARQLEKDMAKEEEVMEALTNSVEVFGGGEAGKARAVAMLKEYGDLDSFNSFVGDLKTRMRDDPESFKVDNYFGQYDGKDPIELLQASRAYVDKRKIDDKPTPTMPIRGGGLLKTIFGTDVEGRAGQRVDERISTNLSAMGLTPRERVSEFPTADIDFRGEQFKLDGMTAKEQVDYITSKIPTLEIGSDRYISLTSQLSKVTNNLGGEARKEELIRRYNAGEKQLLPEIQELSEALNTQEILFSGDKTEVAKLNLKKAIEKGNLPEIKNAQKNLVSLGGMTLKDAQANNLNRAMIAYQNATTPEEKDLAEKQLNEVKKQNEVNLEIQRRLDVGPIDISVVNQYITVRENFVDNAILQDPEVGKYLEKKVDGTLSVNTNVSGSETATATIAAKRKELAQQFMDSLAEKNSGVPEFDFLYNGGNVTLSNTITEDNVGDIVIDYPDTAEGADKLINAIKNSTDPDDKLTLEVVKEAEKNYSPEFSEVIRKEFMRQQTEEGLGATQDAYKEAAFSDEEAVNTLRLDNVVDRIYDLPLIDRKIMGDKSLRNRIMEELNIPMDKATALVPKVKAMIKQKETGLNTGGLMSRGK